MSQQVNLAQEVGKEALKMSPPAGIVGLHVFGVPLESWVIIMTALYLACQLFLIAPKVWAKVKGWIPK